MAQPVEKEPIRLNPRDLLRSLSPEAQQALQRLAHCATNPQAEPITGGKKPTKGNVAGMIGSLTLVNKGVGKDTTGEVWIGLNNDAKNAESTSGKTDATLRDLGIKNRRAVENRDLSRNASRPPRRTVKRRYAVFSTGRVRLEDGGDYKLVSGMLFWVGRTPKPEELGPNPVKYVKGYKPGEKQESVGDRLQELTGFGYKNGDGHPHRMLYNSPDGKTSMGRCRDCGIYKVGKNWLEDFDFVTNTEHRLGV